LESDLIQFAASTHPGLRRNGNEDCYAADAALGLWLVADGIGGHSCGEVAAAIVKATVTREVSRGETLVEAIRHSHSEVLKEIASRETDTRMGSTVVALSILDDNYTVAWVGDSRAYLWDGKELQQLTRDHSHVRDLVDRGVLSHEDIDTHPDRHALTQSIGVSSDMKLELGQQRGHLAVGQQILLCSDGLTDELTDSEIAKQLRRHSSAQGQVDALVNATLKAGGRDNVTVVVVGAPSDSGELQRNTAVEASRQNPWLLPVFVAIVVALGLLALI
jgi:serine/threonine protein phosphatase PrpC